MRQGLPRGAVRVSDSARQTNGRRVEDRRLSEHDGYGRRGFRGYNRGLVQAITSALNGAIADIIRSKEQRNENRNEVAHDRCNISHPSLSP